MACTSLLQSPSPGTAPCFRPRLCPSTQAPSHGCSSFPYTRLRDKMHGLSKRAEQKTISLTPAIRSVVLVSTLAFDLRNGEATRGNTHMHDRDALSMCPILTPCATHGRCSGVDFQRQEARDGTGGEAHGPRVARAACGTLLGSGARTAGSNQTPPLGDGEVCVSSFLLSFPVGTHRTETEKLRVEGGAVYGAQAHTSALSP